MKLREKLLCHSGDKRHLAEDQGHDTPWDISTHRETRKSGSSWNPNSLCPLGGGSMREGWALLTNACVCNRSSQSTNGSRHVLKRKLRQQDEVGIFRGIRKF